MKDVRTPNDALEFLKDLQAPEDLLRHAEIVRETAEQILGCLKLATDVIDPSVVLIGAILHDVGKIKHPRELQEPGHEHEAAGYQMLISYGFSDHIADMCIAHSQWQNTKSLEALIVALADKLWKGKRVIELEDEIIKRVADKREDDFWSLYGVLQTCFDRIADTATERLNKNSK
jgi:putative nucleotidyltransferase with HDIG domain